MMAVCVGASNMRSFLQFLFWGMLEFVFCTLHAIPYWLHHVMPYYQASYWDLFPPAALLRGVLGRVNLTVFVVSLAHLGMLMMGLACVGMQVVYWTRLLKGTTLFEDENGIRIQDTRTMTGKVKSVFGVWWWLGYLLPLQAHRWLKPAEDAVLWPDIKPW
jgi:hypothetical protein